MTPSPRSSFGRRGATMRRWPRTAKPCGSTPTSPPPTSGSAPRCSIWSATRRRWRRWSAAFQTAIPDQSADDRAVLLLDPGLVVLPIRPGARQLDAVLLAEADQHLVEKLAVVVGVDPPQRKREGAAEPIHRVDQRRLLPIPSLDADPNRGSHRLDPDTTPSAILISRLLNVKLLKKQTLEPRPPHSLGHDPDGRQHLSDPATYYSFLTQSVIARCHFWVSTAGSLRLDLSAPRKWEMWRPDDRRRVEALMGCAGTTTSRGASGGVSPCAWAGRRPLCAPGSGATGCPVGDGARGRSRLSMATETCTLRLPAPCQVERLACTQSPPIRPRSG